MAVVAGPISATFTFTDDDGAEGRETVKVPVGTTPAAAVTFATNYAPLLQAASECAMTKFSINLEYYDNTFPVGAAGSDVEDKGVLTFRTANNGSSSLTIPGILESVLLATGTRASTYIDLANTAVAAVVAALISGLSGVQPSTRNGIDMTQIKDAYKQNRASLKSQQRRG